MSNNNLTNIPIRSFGSPGFSVLTLNLYKKNLKTNLIFKFVPYIGKDKWGNDEYCKIRFQSTSVSHEGLVFLYKTDMSIARGNDSEKPIESTHLPCGNNATLLFEYKPDQNNQMAAYLIINKNNETIPFRFPSVEHQMIIDGKWVTTFIQAELGNFAKILEGYLNSISVSNNLNKLPENSNPLGDMGQQPINAAGSSSYQNTPLYGQS